MINGSGQNLDSLGNQQCSAIAGSPTMVGNTIRVATPSIRVQLPNIPCHEVTLVALRLNTGYIFVGDSSVYGYVGTYGVELASRDSFTFAVSNANQLWLDCTVGNEGVSYVAI